MSLPMSSFSLSRDVVPTTGAVIAGCTEGLTHGLYLPSTDGTHEPSLVRIHAREICAMLAPRFLAISSTLMEFKGIIAAMINQENLPLYYFLIAGFFEVRVV